MTIKSDQMHEMSVLKMFDLSSTQLGIKVHHEAEPDLIDATKRLFEKKLVTQVDGGYLTGLGRDAAEHVDSLITILTTA